MSGEHCIYEDANGVKVSTIGTARDGEYVPDGHTYNILAGGTSAWLHFQAGGVATAGVNGITNESLIAVLIHRLGILNAKFPCHENEAAVAHLTGALKSLEARTTARIARGVEGQEVA